MEDRAAPVGSTPEPGPAADARPERALARSAVATLGARGLQSALALVGVAVLLAVLGEERFAAWAVLLGGSNLLVVFDAGSGPTLIRWLTPATRAGDTDGVSRILSSGFFPLLAVYVLVGGAVALLAAPVAAWLRLPATPLFSPAGLVRVAVAGFVVQALLVTLLTPAQAAERWVLVAVVLSVAAVLANASAWIAGVTTGRLDLVAVTYWGGYAAGLAGGAIVARGRGLPWRLTPARIDGATFRTMLGHGWRLQVSQVCSIVNFQLGKLLLPAHAGLAAVAPLDAAERGHAGLRGFPLAVLNLLLPEISARTAEGKDSWRIYERMTRTAALAVVVGLALPVALSPLLFRAWVGDLAPGAIRLFVVLLPGMALNLLAAPISVMVQGLGRPGLQAAAAAASLVLNVVLLLLLVSTHGALGVAVAASGAMTLSSIAYGIAFHRVRRRSLATTAAAALRLAGPLLPVPLAVWFVADAAAHALGDDRLLQGAAGLGLLLAGLVVIVLLVRRRGVLGERERGAAASLPVIGRWFA